MSNDWNQKEDPIFDKLTELTIGKINQIEGGLSSKGRIVTDQEKKLKSDNMKGVANKGRKHSDEVRKKMSESHMGKVSPNKGKSPSAETRAKLSKAGSKPYAIYQGVTYTGIGLAEKLGFPNPNKVSQIKAGKKKDEWGIIFL